MSTKIRYNFSGSQIRAAMYSRNSAARRKLTWLERFYCAALIVAFGIILAYGIYGSMMGGH